MKTFKFRLQTVLEQRERTETAARQTLVETELAVGRAETLLTELRDVREAILSELRRQDAPFDPTEAQVYQDYMQTITASIRDQQAFLHELCLEREAHKLHLVCAAQKRQALTHVHDRDKSAHTLARQRAEQSVLDELSTVRFNHARRGQEQDNL